MIWCHLGAAAKPGEIVYSNGYAIIALARAAGAEVTDLGIARDKGSRTSPLPYARGTRRGPISWSPAAGRLSVSTIWCSGGSKPKASIYHSGACAIRPGRPMMHGRLGGMHVLGVPGNPVSAYVCAFLFLVPLIARLSGRGNVERRPEAARLGCDLPANDERADYLRAVLTAGPDGPIATTLARPGQFPDGAARQGILSADS